MILDRVTFTGADDSVDPAALAALATDFPFVEFGLLFSKKRQGAPRYPSPAWLERLVQTFDAPGNAGVSLAAHLCGGWVRDLVLRGDYTFPAAYPALYRFVERVQLNFHGDPYVPHDDLTGVLGAESRQFIVQVDGVNDGLALQLVNAGLAVPLFDKSGGAGQSPLFWLPPLRETAYTGYAGGLGPDNVIDELKRIDDVVPDETLVWIDMERRVRSADDKTFDLGKVREVLEAIAPAMV